MLPVEGREMVADLGPDQLRNEVGDRPGLEDEADDGRRVHDRPLLARQAVEPGCEKGRDRRRDDDVAAGQPVATVTGLREQVPVPSPHAGRAVEWLVEPGDPVSPGQPLLRLYPQEDSL